MDRPLATILFFSWAIVFSNSPIFVDSRRQYIRLTHSHSHSHSQFSSSPSSNLSPPPTLKPDEHTTPGRPTHHHPPPPPIHRKNSRHSPHFHQHSPTGHPHSNKRKVNIGKKIGLLFAGIAVFLQVAFGLFLGVKRWQISKMEGRAS